MGTKTVIKKTRQQAIVKLVGTGSYTITPVDIKLADETLASNGNVTMNINSVIYSLVGATASTVARGATTVMELTGNDNWSFSQMMGFVENESNSSNITVTLNGGGMIYMGITKSDGFKEPNNQELKDYQKN